MVPQTRPLIEVLAEIPDFRSNHCKRHPLAAILALACSAMLCGYRSYTAIAAWGRHYGEHLVQALGFTHRSPCAATLHTVLRRVDREALEHIFLPHFGERRTLSKSYWDSCSLM